MKKKIEMPQSLSTWVDKGQGLAATQDMVDTDWADILLLSFGSICFIAVGTMLWDEAVFDDDAQDIMFPMGG